MLDIGAWVRRAVYGTTHHLRHLDIMKRTRKFGQQGLANQWPTRLAIGQCGRWGDRMDLQEVVREAVPAAFQICRLTVC